MSTSRLEKFIYAICSMEVSDLPAPLSRIEILWNCLITGETPDFEPQSRNEQYLMAMLGLYELDQLPTPLSRGEKLLYKIAMGETDLSDIPAYLSRYEELLGYLAENGGVGDFEYILQTLNQRLSTLYSTKERPMKQAVIKGDTLANIKGEETVKTSNDNRYHDFLIPLVKKNTDYLIKYDTTISGGVLAVGFLKDGSSWSNNRENQPNTGLFKLNSGEYPNYFRIIGRPTETVTVNNLMIIEYQEGMENWDIPYFEGMQSVQLSEVTTTGKNLFDKENVVNGTFMSGSLTIDPNNNNLTLGKDNAIKVEPNTSYTFSFATGWQAGALGLNATKTAYTVDTKWQTNSNGYTFTTDANTNYVTFNIKKSDNSIVQPSDIDNAKLMLEKGSVATPYEPYQSTTLTLNEPVTLRKVGDVQDTLDGLTGEVTERVGEVIFDGSDDEYWFSPYVGSNTFCIHTPFENAVRYNRLVCDKFNTSDSDLYGSPKEGVYVNKNRNLQVNILKSRLETLDENGFKIFLSKNPITIQYQLATESTNNINSTTVDQDGQPTKLKTFNDITHVEINADPIVPSVDVEVATKISETLATLDPQQLDISNTQNELGQTIDKQAENTDATMMATTEIYEQTL